MVDDNKGEHGEEVNAMRLENDPQSIELFEEILRDSLTELFERLCCSDCGDEKKLPGRGFRHNSLVRCVLGQSD